MSVMFEKIGQAAEKVASAVSRRGFLGRLGKAALVASSALGAILALPGDAQARHPRHGRCCYCPRGEDFWCYVIRRDRGCPSYCYRSACQSWCEA